MNNCTGHSGGGTYAGHCLACPWRMVYGGAQDYQRLTHGATKNVTTDSLYFIGKSEIQ